MEKIDDIDLSEVSISELVINKGEEIELLAEFNKKGISDTYFVTKGRVNILEKEFLPGDSFSLNYDRMKITALSDSTIMIVRDNK